jgi:hypothetical protein
LTSPGTSASPVENATKRPSPLTAGFSAPRMSARGVAPRHVLERRAVGDEVERPRGEVASEDASAPEAPGRVRVVVGEEVARLRLEDDEAPVRGQVDGLRRVVGLLTALERHRDRRGAGREERGGRGRDGGEPADRQHREDDAPHRTVTVRCVRRRFSAASAAATVTR